MTWKNEIKKEVQDMSQINSVLEDLSGELLGLIKNHMPLLQGYAGAADIEAKLNALSTEILTNARD
tara:strand:- start:1545 stop:1742 length:198 start_codon:yes stop_codon:yes gene_type:complete